jgi:hypothetical protein
METSAIYLGFIHRDPGMNLTVFQRRRCFGSAFGNTGYRIEDLVALLLAYHKPKSTRKRQEHIIHESGGFVKGAGTIKCISERTYTPHFVQSVECIMRSNGQYLPTSQVELLHSETVGDESYRRP